MLEAGDTCLVEDMCNACVIHNWYPNLKTSNMTNLPWQTNKQHMTTAPNWQHPAHLVTPSAATGELAR